jgi:hypothetical protein
MVEKKHAFDDVNHPYIIPLRSGILLGNATEEESHIVRPRVGVTEKKDALHQVNDPYVFPLRSDILIGHATARGN